MDDRQHKPFPDTEFTPAELKALGHCNALTNQEAKIVLKRLTEQTSKANKTWLPPPLAQKAMEYLDKVEKKTDLDHQDTVARLREVVLAANVYEFEMSLLANLMPENADEAMTLIPSLQDRFGSDDTKQHLQDILDQILTLKELQ